MLTGLMSILGAFGLSGAAGLNAYIPLLAIALAHRTGIVHLASPYDALGTWWMIAVLAVLLVVEIVVDKVPGADHVNDLVQTIIRPTAGAILFAAEAGLITHISPYLALGLGLVLALGVHGVKALARPVVNVSTAGFGAPVLSVLEDAVSLTASILAILAPILLMILFAVVGWITWRFWRRLRRRKLQAQESFSPPGVAAEFGGH